MVQWLREKFESWVGVFFVLFVAIIGIASGICGATAFGFKGFIGGLLIGGLFAFFYCGFICGYFATIAGIAKSNEANTKLLGEIKTKLLDLEAIKNKLNETPAN